MRVAIVGASHWHVGIYYLPALQGIEEVQIVGIADPNEAALERVAKDLQCPRFTDFRRMLDEVEVDLVFAHAPHAQMTQVAAELVSRHLPFHMEKPMGIDWRELAPVATKAQTEGIFTSVALVSRHYPSVQRLRQLKEEGRLGQPVHYYYRLFAGAPLRYPEWDCAWMLDPDQAGGGPLFNFGPHVIDLFLYLAEDIREIRCLQSHAVYHAAIEDLTSLVMVGESGAVGVGDVSYTMPEGYERYFSLTTTALHYGGDFDKGTIFTREGENIPVEGVGAEGIYELYTREVIRRFQAKEPAIADICDMLKTLRVMNAAQESARSGRSVTLAPGTNEE